MIDFESKRLKFFGILAFLLLTFTLFVSNAYKYIPEQDRRISSQEEASSPKLEADISEITSQENINETSDVDIVEEIAGQTMEENKAQSPSNSSLRESILESIENPVREDLVLIEDSASVENRNINPVEPFSKVKEYKKQEDYESAVRELKKILEASNDVVIKSQCYEELAIIFGIDKHYGTALAYAQKAYNMYPTTNREVLLARLYYKTGDTEKANNRINNVLKRDFWADR